MGNVPSYNSNGIILVERWKGLKVKRGKGGTNTYVVNGKGE